MPTKEQKALEKKAERIALNPKRPVLTASEQLDQFAKARLVLRLKAPSDIFDHTERETLRKKQVHQIEQFISCLEENLVNEFGSCLVCVYSCE
jgi:hypothetical protein